MADKMLVDTGILPPKAELDPEQLARFIEVRFARADADELVGIWRPRVPGVLVRSRDIWVGVLREDGDSRLHALYWGETEAPKPEPSGPHDIYVTMQSLLHKPASGRGKTADMRRAFGCWLDLDVKGGQTWDEVLGVVHRLDSLGLRAQLMVASGGGGAHLHWLYEAPQEVVVAVMDSERVQLLVEREFPGWEVDDVADATRVLRGPGTARVKRPHQTEGAGWDVRPVGLLREDAGTFVNRARLVELTGETYEKVRRNRIRDKESRVRREREGMRRFSAEFVARFGDAGEIGTAWRITELIRLFDAEMPWSRILGAAAWTHAGHDGSADVWTRPGGASAGKHSVAERSATTGYPHEWSAMSLFSGSADTGLLELKKAGVALTKLRVAAELFYEGRTEDVLLAWAREASEKGLWS